ncbi:unnamed protein product [Ixodes hexagonus]
MSPFLVTALPALTLLLSSQYCRATTNVLCASCDCKPSLEQESSEDVICSRQGLEMVPAGSQWPRNLYKFDLSHNFIKQLTTLEPSNVSVLDLHVNSISLIEPGVFSVFPNLRVLDLSQNSLSSLHMDTFKGLSNLKSLNISRNNIRVLPSELFNPLVSLEQLRISYNPLRYFERSCFSNLANLEVLEMSSVDAHSLPDGVFHTMPRLVYLDLSANSFDEVPSSALRSAEGLKVLVISDNPIRVLNYKSFYKMSNIEELYIENMKELVSVEGDTFEYQKRMRVLYLDNNPKLTDLDLDIFGIFWRMEPPANWTLKELYLQDNNIKWIDSDVAPWKELTVLDLQGNPLACDCNNAWLRKIPLQPELTVRLWCGSPSSHEREPLLEAPEEIFVCSGVSEKDSQTSALRTAVFVVGTLSLVAILLSAILLVKRKALHERFLRRKGRNGSVYYVKAHTNPVEDYHPNA